MVGNNLPAHSPLRQILTLSQEAKAFAANGELDVVLSMFRRVAEGIEVNRSYVDSIKGLRSECAHNWGMAVNILETFAKHDLACRKKELRNRKRNAKRSGKNQYEHQRILQHDLATNLVDVNRDNLIIEVVKAVQRNGYQLTLKNIDWYLEMVHGTSVQTVITIR